MDTLVENTGVTEQEKQIQAVPTENEKQVQAPIENAETVIGLLSEEDTTVWKSQGREPDIKIVRAEEKPDPLGRKATNLPLNEMKAGYDYAFGKGKTKR